MLGSLGISEIVIVLAIALLIFGPRQLPKIGRSLGQSIREFRNVGKALAGDDADES